MSYREHVIILSGIVSHNLNIPFGRYAGAYVIATELEDLGYEVTVVDWFLLIDDFHEYINKIIKPSTIAICMSASFLFPPREKNMIRDTHVAGQSFVYDDDLEEGNYKEGIDEEFLKSQLFYLWETDNKPLKEWCQKLKNIATKKNPKIKFIMGGHRLNAIYRDHNLIDKDYALQLFDYFLLGHAETAIKELFKAISSDTLETIEFEDKNGLKFINCNQGKYNHFMKPLKPIRYTKRHGVWKNEFLSIEPSRGCAFNCSFCSYEKNQLYKKDLQKLKEEFIENYETLGVTHYHFTSDCFNDRKKFVMQFADMVATLPFKIEYTTYARIDVFHKNLDMMDAMLESGFIAGWFGIESFNIEAAKRIGKNAEHAKELLTILREKSSKIWITTNMIIGLPGETLDSLEETLQWLKKQKIVDEMMANILTVPSFIEELDSIIDFSNMTKNPEKFGFTRLEYFPKFYWEHDTMNLRQSVEVKNHWRKELNNHTFTRFGGSARGEFPMVRSMGLSQENAKIYMKTKFNHGESLVNYSIEEKNRIRKAVVKKVFNTVKNYHESILEHHAA